MTETHTTTKTHTTTADIAADIEAIQAYCDKNGYSIVPYMLGWMGREAAKRLADHAKAEQTQTMTEFKAYETARAFDKRVAMQRTFTKTLSFQYRFQIIERGATLVGWVNVEEDGTAWHFMIDA